MATWNSRGLRGSTLEDLINRTNEKYQENGLALIQKIIEKLCLSLVFLLHGSQTALIFQPLKHLAAHVNAVGWRCIVK